MTGVHRCVVHFFHRDFERCKIADKHLASLAQKYFRTRFVKLSAPDSPFFVEKLGVQILPCIVFFLNGVAVDRLVGFDELGAKDDFKTDAFEAKLLKAGVVELAHAEQDSDEEEAEQRTRIRKGGDFVPALKAARGEEQDDDDESSDFSD